MNVASFLIAVRRRASRHCESRDPLADARRFLNEHGDTGEGQALRRIIAALQSGDGEFVESDVFLFSSELLALVDALIESRINSLPLYSEDEWRRCV